MLRIKRKTLYLLVYTVLFFVAKTGFAAAAGGTNVTPPTVQARTLKPTITTTPPPQVLTVTPTASVPPGGTTGFSCPLGRVITKITYGEKRYYQTIPQWTLSSAILSPSAKVNINGVWVEAGGTTTSYSIATITCSKLADVWQ